MAYAFTSQFAAQRDASDALASFRSQFILPQHNGQEVVYLTGNSLGLQPKKAGDYLREELEDWATYGVEGHTQARRPWVNYHQLFTASLARLVGAQPEEVVAMNGLTTNLHLLLVSFYRPQGKRFKILCEGKAFPSDLYALRSQARFHGYDPDEAVIELTPDPTTELIPVEQIKQVLAQQGEEIALMMLGGVNYYTGQLFPMQELTALAQSKGIVVGWDLAHAAGNVDLNLHHWGVDFAAWCGYKYLNSGPGGVSGVFINKRHLGKADIPRFEGWWGHDAPTRFAMPHDFVPMPTAEAWQLSNAPVFSMTPLRASLDLFDQVNWEDYRTKRRELTNYLEFVLHQLNAEFGEHFRILTPAEPDQRGCQLSVVSLQHGKIMFDYLTAHGVVADWREPAVIRMAPVPLYNSFTDIYRLGQVLQEFLKTH